jgi:hypothetical protein
MLKSVASPTLPACDFCRHPSNGAKTVPAVCNTETRFGPRAYVCEVHLTQYGSEAQESKTPPLVPAQRAGGSVLCFRARETGNQ